MSKTKNPTPKENAKTIFSILKGDFNFPGYYLQTKPFLEACQSAITVMDLFGKAFSPIIYDMGNIVNDLNDLYLKDEDSYSNLEVMVLRNMNPEGMTVIEGIKWLERLLRFLNVFFQMIIDDMERDQTTNYM